MELLNLSPPRSNSWKLTKYLEEDSGICLNMAPAVGEEDVPAVREDDEIPSRNDKGTPVTCDELRLQSSYSDDQEEGEISETEEVVGDELKPEKEPLDLNLNLEAGDTETESFSLKKMASLDDDGNDVVGRPSKGRDELFKRDVNDDVIPWLREKPTYLASPNSSYPPNLYNLAWAQAVQGGPGFKLVKSPSGKEDGDDDQAAEGLQSFVDAKCNDEEDEMMMDWQVEGGSDAIEMSVTIPEGYDMRERLYDRRRMRSAMWNGNGKERKWPEVEEDLQVRRRFGRDESRTVVISRRDVRSSSSSRRRDGKLTSSSSMRREDLEVGDVERERRNERDRVWESEKQRARDREREREKERERADRKLSSSLVHRPTSSDDDSFHSCDGPSASKRGKQFQIDDNAAAAAAPSEVREEGEIEEGEIELNSTTHAPSSRSPSRDKSEDLQADNMHSEERISRNGNSKKSSLSSRLSFQSRSSHSRSLSRDSFVRLQDDDLRHRLSRDAEREKLQGEHRMREERRERIAQVGSLLKSVTVKDAQKSFISTCQRLNDAMELLEDLGRQRSSLNVNQSDGLPRDVPKLATKVFQGLRAVYAVWNTASGREQERDKDTFPRLLELVNRSYLKLFTPKQARELKEFMEQTIKASRRSGIEGGVQASIKPMQPSQDSDTRPHRKPSDDMTTSTSLTRKSSGSVVAMEIPENKSSSENPAESKHKIDEAAIAAAALAYAKSSAAAFANITHGSTGQPANNYLNADQGHWGWNAMNAYEQSMSPGLPPGYSGRSHSAKDSGVQGQANGHGSFHISAPNSSNHAYNEWMPTAMENKQKMASNSHYNLEWAEHKNKTVEIKNKHVLQNTRTPYRHGYLEEDWEAMSPPHANPSVYTSAVRKTVKADERGFPLSSTESAIVNIPHIKMSNFRLPSPTPDEEDDNNNKEVEISAPLPPPPPVLTELTSLRQKPLLPLPKPLNAVPLTARPFYTTLNTHVDETGRVHYASVPMGMAMPVDQDQALNFEQPKSHQGSGPVLASFRSRDPRRQQLRNEYMEVNDYPQHPNGQFKYPWPTSIQSGPFVTSRKREGEGYSHEIDTSKRLKMAGSNSGLLGSEPSVAGLAIGGWLDDHTTLSSSQENSDIQAMDIDMETPINVEKKQGIHLDSEGAVIRSTDVPRDNSLSEVAGLRPSVKTLENEVSDSISVRTLKLEEQADDGGKPRMRSRDPRRALLELSVQKENGISEVDPVHEPGAVAQPRKRSPSPSNLHPTPQSQLSANLGYTQSLILEGPSNLNGVNPSSAAEDMNINEKSREKIKSGDMDSVKQSTFIAGEINPGSDTDGLESEDPLSRKPQLGPNHWGGNELHPDLEQLLGNLDDAERLAIQRERKRRMEEQDRMFSAGKLCLVLDLDHTLLNSAKFVEIEPEWETRLRAAENLERSRASKEGNTKRELYRFSHMGMWTKLRPGIWNFLAKASELYELHVYTMGNKAYATEMAKLLDPTGALFAGRVISKGDGGDVVDSDDKLPKSKDLDGVLGMESAVVIIDDSARVWPHHRENLIVVERYMYFPCSRRQFGLPGPSLLEVGHDERPADGMLASTLAVIDRIHKRFFSNKRLREVDVRAILAAEQRQVLAGCCVLFSRIFPVGEANPHVHPLWRMAEQFGATCCLNINDKVTHVVAISLGTDKVNWASATGRPVVRPTWLEASALLYRRANEQDFPVPP